MTLSDLRVLVDNLDEYIHIPGGIERLRKTVLHLAVSGQLVPQFSNEGTGEDLYEEVKVKYTNKKLLPEISENDQPFEVPASWHWTRLGNISDSNIGLTYSPGDIAEKGTAVLRSGNIQDNKMNYEDLVYVKSNVPDSKMAHKGDLLICARNGSRRLVGKNALVEREGMSFGAFMALVRSDFNEFIKLYLDSPEFRRKLDGVQTTTINQITQGLLSNFAFPLPPFQEQRRIVKKVDEIFTIIDELSNKYQAEEEERRKFVKSSLRTLAHNKSTLALDNLANTIKTKADATELRKAILHLAVSGWLVPQIPSEGSAKDLIRSIRIGSIKSKKLPEISNQEIPFDIPVNWVWTRLGEIIQVSSGNSLVKSLMSDNGKYAVYGGNGISGYHNEFMFEQQRIVIGRVGAQCGNVHITETNSWVTDNAFVVSYPEEHIHREFLVMLLRFLNLRKTHKGSAQPVISGSSIYPVPLQLPPLAEQKRIVEKANELLDLVTELEKHLEN